MRILPTMFAALAALLLGQAHAGEGAREGTLYKNPDCTCCDAYAEYLENNGFEVTIKPTHDLALIKRMAGVPPQLEGCHTLMIDGYTVEGHVPIDVLTRLLSERPDIKGISLPGMPLGSPGMGGEKEGPFTIYEFSGGPPEVYAVE